MNQTPGPGRAARRRAPPTLFERISDSPAVRWWNESIFTQAPLQVWAKSFCASVIYLTMPIFFLSTSRFIQVCTDERQTLFLLSLAMTLGFVLMWSNMSQFWEIACTPLERLERHNREREALFKESEAHREQELRIAMDSAERMQKFKGPEAGVLVGKDCIDVESKVISEERGK